jgi:hypothetical protein
VYAQYFIYDPDKAARLRFGRNTTLSLSLLRGLDDIIRQFNPHYRLYQTAYEVLRATSNSQPTRIVISPRLNLIVKKDADQRRENLPVVSEVVLLLPGEDDRPSRRNLILTARPARDAAYQTVPLQEISYTHPLYYTLHYVLLYPYGMVKLTHDSSPLNVY